MFSFNYNYCDHLDYLQLLADALDAPVSNNILWLPAKAGAGYIQVEALANGLQVLTNECTLHQDFLFKRNAAAGHHFTLRFDEVRNLKALSVKQGDLVLEDNTAIYSGAFLSNPLQPLEYIVNAETESRCVNIYFTKEWFQQHFGIAALDLIWNSILPVDRPVAHFEVLTIEYRELMEDIFALRKEQPLYLAALQNRAMLLLEKFLRNLYGKIIYAEQVPVIAETDLKRMILIEAILAKNVGEAPPPVPELARTAMMSETNLKNLFKKIYDYSLFEYYQKNRMLKARQLIASRKYSVKEVGSRLGFKNLSNFTIAFKKQFNKLPSEL
ncbi:MAG: helix-turn-helix transcriptional regulator [Chitinophagaceae bacterium]|nr:helix-turn-helix transcriptional regulator [Chitinophagaceae bacterium]